MNRRQCVVVVAATARCVVVVVGTAVRVVFGTVRWQATCTANDRPTTTLNSTTTCLKSADTASSCTNTTSRHQHPANAATASATAMGRGDGGNATTTPIDTTTGQCPSTTTQTTTPSITTTGQSSSAYEGGAIANGNDELTTERRDTPAMGRHNDSTQRH
ncbi:hypothetical protein EDB89DRAFT_1913856 [Lactarius sanguifluus]|nr:hypothetical protein EDB89DRAFT_1913856 [Lactarius sanguifluus]